MESEDWKVTTDSLIKLQKEWKEVGPVPRKQSEKIWKRFRKACDHFFTKKAQHFAIVDTSYEDNLTAKKNIILELEKFDETINDKEAFEQLKDIQRRWMDIGFVPFNAKEEINQSYRNALNKQFDRLKIDDGDKNILKYRNKLESVKSNPKLARKVRTEREKFFTRIRQLEGDITLWENNIGFFAKSKTAESLISEVEEKIENAKKTIRILEEKVKMIDLTGLDD
jgi:3-methyladenine DNA glycosylase Tag